MESQNISNNVRQLVDKWNLSYNNSDPSNHLNDRETFNSSLSTHLHQTISQDWVLFLTILIIFLSLLSLVLISLFIKWYLSMEKKKCEEVQQPGQYQIFHIDDESFDLATISVSSSMIIQ